MWSYQYFDFQSPQILNLEGLQTEPWFQDMEQTPQDTIWHAEGNVQIHTLMVLDALFKHPEFLKLEEQDKHILAVAALMHDIEKRSTTTEEWKDGRWCIVAPHHAARGEKTARNILYQNLECPFEIREQICKLIRYHGAPLHQCSERQILSLACLINLKLLALLAEVDILGRTCQDAKEQLEKIDFFRMFAEDLNCYEKVPEFYSPLARFLYFNKEKPLQYQPYETSSFEVIMMCGLPGAGKDTYVKSQNLPVVSLDDIRIELKIKPSDKSGNGTVFQVAKERAKEFLRKKKSFIWNATNVHIDRRKQLVELFLEYDAKIKIVLVEVPYKKLIQQNLNRSADVPAQVMKNMIERYDPPTILEAHAVEYILK